MENKLTVIIPLHTFDNGVGELTSKAIASVMTNEHKGVRISIVCPPSIEGDVKAYVEAKLKGIEIPIDIVVNTTGGHNFQKQVNFAVENVETEYFSILEYDDAYSEVWFRNAWKYIENDPKIDVCLPIVEHRLFETNEMVSFGNEITWARGFADEYGVIDFDCLDVFFDFHMTGGIFRTKEFIEIGGLKPSIELVFWYEYLLRSTNSGQRIYVVPKYGYTHYIEREGSLNKYNQIHISEDNAKAWVNYAKRVYMDKEDTDKPIVLKVENETDQLT